MERTNDPKVKLVTARELSHLTSIPERTLYRLAERGDLPAVRFGRRIVRFDLTRVIDLIADRGTLEEQSS